MAGLVKLIVAGFAIYIMLLPQPGAAASPEMWEDCATSDPVEQIFCTIKPTQKENGFLLSSNNWFLENCDVPTHIKRHPELVSFVASTTLVMTVGRDYSGSNGGDRASRLRDRFGPALAGKTYAENLTCAGANNHVEKTVTYLKRLKTENKTGRFVKSCSQYYSGEYTSEQCECLREIGSTVIPEISQSEFSRDVIPTLIRSNPFIGMQIIGQCKIGNY